MTRLTENEKAATFVGWAPRPDVPCPDMRLPNNYIAALNAVARRGFYVDISIYRAVGGPHFTGIWIKDGATCECADEYECTHVGPKLLAVAMNAHGGTAAVGALAAFYDRESE